jgi:hypothetical protein
MHSATGIVHSGGHYRKVNSISQCQSFHICYMLENNKNLERHALTCFVENRTIDFSRVARLVGEDTKAKEGLKKGLLEIAKADQSYEDIQTREAALNVMAVLGFTKLPEVHSELCDLFPTIFNTEDLEALAVFDDLPKTKQCGMLCSKMRFLQSLLRVLLHVNDESGLSIGREVSKIFGNSPFGRKIRRWVAVASINNP